MKLTFDNWKIERLQNILPEEFFALIERNVNHIRKTFPKTLYNCLDLDKTIQFLGENIDKEENGGGYHFYVRNLETSKLIGYVSIKNVDRNIMKCELAYFVDRDFEGKGVISKAVSEVMKFSFLELRMNKIFICTSLENLGSQRIATKHGFVEEGILRQEFKSADGILEDIKYFGLLKHDYKP
ncbi:GNAT family N-acetyltransferase [Flavobacterium sp.]|uniref:GNAT family N-acetyltransferase n=1 Tax=Flavobacterium sp. TaxID=239 RepID=UPI00121A8DF7|nr:GNAT family N-acetyltransferase [Flavobacterium sp.]RZJ72033.1 MAG: N-acetyltransferase [Flavobacterium sp.]